MSTADSAERAARAQEAYAARLAAQYAAAAAARARETAPRSSPRVVPPPPVKPIINNTPIIAPPIIYPPFVPPDSDYNPDTPNVRAEPIGSGDNTGEDIHGNPTVYVPGVGFVPATINEYGTASPIKQFSGGSDTFVPPKDAMNTISAVLDTYGLAGLSSYLYDVYARQEVDITNSDALIYAIKDQPAYQQRFAGNAARTKKGLAELSPGTYVRMEDAYRQLLQANGLPAGFYDNIEDFQKFIEADTSPRELQDRIQLGFNEVDAIGPEGLKQIRLLYPEAGVGDSRESLAAFILDPVKAAPVLIRRAQAAKAATRGFEAGYQLNATQAEGLVTRGYSDAQIQSTFSDLGTQAGLLNAMEGEAKLTQDEKLGAGFGYDSAAKVKVERRKATRKAIFSDGGRFSGTSGATSGTSTSSIGTAN